MVAVTATTEGQLLTKLNRREEAQTALKTALAARRSLVAQFPANIDHQHLESFTLNLLGNLRRDAKDYVAARDRYRASAELLRGAVAAKSDNEKYQLALITVLNDLAQAHVQLGEWNDAVNVALELAGVRPGQSWAYAQAAGVLARSIGKLGIDQSLTPEQRAKATENTAAQAIELLAQSIKLGNPTVYSLADDPRFERLHDYPAFRELVKHPDAPPDRSPTRFTLDYQHDDPGKRIWKRDGDAWTETMPSGRVNRFKITQRRWILNFFGTEIAAEDRPISLFIPDKGSPAPIRLLFRSKPGDWVSLGTMEEIE
jgi:hypothetical protein